MVYTIAVIEDGQVEYEKEVNYYTMKKILGYLDYN